MRLFFLASLLIPGPEGATAGISTGVGPAVVIASNALQPQAAIGAGGEVYVVSVHAGNVSVSVSRDRGRSFDSPVTAIDTGGRTRAGLQRGPRIGVDGKGAITVTAPVVLDPSEYEKRYPTADLVLVRSRDGGRTWTSPVRINEAEKKAPEALHWMAVDPGGEAHVAWLDIRRRPRGGQDLFYALVKDGKVGKNVSIAGDVCNCCAPGLSVDGRGLPVIAWREGGSKQSREILAARAAARGGRFGAPAQLNSRPSNEGG